MEENFPKVEDETLGGTNNTVKMTDINGQKGTALITEEQLSLLLAKVGSVRVCICWSPYCLSYGLYSRY